MALVYQRLPLSWENAVKTNKAPFISYMKGA